MYNAIESQRCRQLENSGKKAMNKRTNEQKQHMSQQHHDFIEEINYDDITCIKLPYD